MKKDYKSSLISALIGLMIANAIYDLLLPIPYSYRNSDCFRYPSRPRDWAISFLTTIIKKANIKRSQINNLASFSTLNSFLSSPSG